MVYLHILGDGRTTAEIADCKGHLFERLIRDLFEHLKMTVTDLNKSENGKEIDIEGTTVVGKVKFFAECKAQDDPLNSPDLQKFGYKFMIKTKRNPDVRGYLFTLSPLNAKAQEVWDSEIKNEYPNQVDCYGHDDIVGLLIKHHGLTTPESIQQQAKTEYHRNCGDTQLLCVEDTERNPHLFWAQLLMSSDGTEPNGVVIYSSTGTLVREQTTVERLLRLKPDLATNKLSCFNIAAPASRFDDVSPSRSVVRVRMSSSWFDYRFPAAPEFFVGRGTQLAELKNYIKEIREGKTLLLFLDIKMVIIWS